MDCLNSCWFYYTRIRILLCPHSPIIDNWLLLLSLVRNDSPISTWLTHRPINSPLILGSLNNWVILSLTVRYRICPTWCLFISLVLIVIHILKIIEIIDSVHLLILFFSFLLFSQSFPFCFCCLFFSFLLNLNFASSFSLKSF